MNIYRVLYILRLYVQSVCRWRVGGDFSFESYTYVSRAWLDAWTTDNGSSPATNTNHEPRGWMRVAPRWHGRGSDRPHPTRRDHAQSTRWASWGWGSTDPWSGYVDGRSEVLFVIDVVVVVVWWRMASNGCIGIIMIWRCWGYNQSWVEFRCLYLVCNVCTRRAKRKILFALLFKLKYEKKLNKKNEKRQRFNINKFFLIFFHAYVGIS